MRTLVVVVAHFSGGNEYIPCFRLPNNIFRPFDGSCAQLALISECLRPSFRSIGGIYLDISFSNRTLRSKELNALSAHSVDSGTPRYYWPSAPTMPNSVPCRSIHRIGAFVSAQPLKVVTVPSSRPCTADIGRPHHMLDKIEMSVVTPGSGRRPQLPASFDLPTPGER